MKLKTKKAIVIGIVFALLLMLVAYGLYQNYLQEIRIKVKDSISKKVAGGLVYERSFKSEKTKIIIAPKLQTI